jgi:hypothetical protein
MFRLNSFEPWQEFIAPDGSHRLCSPNTAAKVCNGRRPALMALWASPVGKPILRKGNVDV